jgi:UDP-glucose 4-epimerase
MKIKVGVTGASGFIGKHLVQELLANGYQVSVFVRSNQDFPKEVKVIQGDLHELASIKRFLNDVDTVVHLAGRQLPPDNLFFQDNVTATNNLVQCMLESHIKHAIILSTIAVYGDRKDIVYKESDDCSPTTYYGFTKYLAEKIFQYWETVSQQKLTILRPFNIYGDTSTKGVVFNLVKSVKENQKITIYGDGSQSRDFLYVSDVVNAIMISLKSQKSGIFNLGTGGKISILELVKLIEKVSARKVQIHYEKSESGKTKDINYSVQKVSDELGWKAQVSLEDGLRKILQ